MKLSYAKTNEPYIFITAMIQWLVNPYKKIYIKQLLFYEKQILL